MFEKDEEMFQSSNRFQICGKLFDAEDDKVT